MLSTFNDHRRALRVLRLLGWTPDRRAGSAGGSTARAPGRGPRQPRPGVCAVASAVRIQSPRRYQYRYSSDASRLDRQSRRPIRGIAPASGLFLSVFPVQPQPHRPCEAMRQRFKRTALTAIAHQGCRSLEINLGGSLRWDEARNHSRCGVQAGPTSRSSNPC